MSNPKIVQVWVVDPLVTNPLSVSPPELHVGVDKLIPPPTNLHEYPSPERGITLLSTIMSPFRGWWVLTSTGGGPGPRGGYAPMANSINAVFKDERPIARVLVHEPSHRTSVWFLDLDHAARLVKQRVPNMHMQVWPDFAKNGVMEWVPVPIHPVCRWNVGTSHEPQACDEPAKHAYAGRTAALCDIHKAEHDKFFALERGRA